MKKKIFHLFIILILITPIIYTLAKYINRANYEAYLISEEFYFYSDVLTYEGITYDINNWDGISYTIDFNVSNALNDKAWTSYDITYLVAYTCSDDLVCTLLTPSTDTLVYNASSKTTNTISLEVKTKDGVTLNTDDLRNVSISITSKTKYQKELKANFNLTVGNYGISYKIIDSASSYYLTLQINNSSTQIKNLNLSFDNTLINVDDTNLDIISGAIRDDNGNINGLNISVGNKEEIIINFYKEDINANYTYPFITTESIITILEV